MSSLLYSTKNTRALPVGGMRYIRSDFPGALTEEEICRLLENNIRTIVDLRSDMEVTAKPCILKDRDGFIYFHLPVTGGSKVPDSPEQLHIIYEQMLDEQMEKIAHVIMNAGTNVMYFCTAGKDRTGVVSAVILKRLGVSDEVIIDDYMKSKDNLLDMLTEYGRLHPERAEVVMPCRENIKQLLTDCELFMTGNKGEKASPGNLPISLYSQDISDYLKCDEAADFDDKSVSETACRLFSGAADETGFIRAAYEFVRDKISHSADINAQELTYTASQVLAAGHGICFAKSHLLAALLRCRGVPAGFCYQRILLDENAEKLVYHGLCGVYIREAGRWIRLDPRGNKNGVNAQFSIETEQLAYPIRPELGEKDVMTVYPVPDKVISDKLKRYGTRTELWDDLPEQLGYDSPSD